MASLSSKSGRLYRELDPRVSLSYRPTYMPVPAAAAVKAKISTIGKIFLAVFFVVLFEGAIRKWISPALTVPLVLLRDCLALYGIYWAFSRGKVKTTNGIFKFLIWWTVILVSWGLFQLIVNQNSLFIYFIGLRFWLLYLWFACIAAVAMTEYDFRVIIKTIMLVVLCITPLIVLQFYSSPSAFINKQVEDDDEKVFKLTADFVRTTGLFSFTLGQSTLLAIASPFVLSALMGVNYFLKKNKLMPVMIFIALCICTMLSGSRAALAMFVIIFMTMVFVEIFFFKRKRNSSKLVVLIISLAIVVLVPFLFTSALNATTERVVSASESEALDERIAVIFLGEPKIREKLSFIGHGFGMGTNLVGALSKTQFALGEAETGRVLMEGGVIGFVFIFLKFAILLVAIKKSFFIARSTGNTLPILLWISLIFAMLSWSIIGQLTVNALGYMFFGLGITALRFAGARK